MSPVFGESSASRSRMNVDLPEPEGPIRKTNSPLSILTLMSSSAGRADALYFLLTLSRVIITARQCSGEFRRQAKSAGRRRRRHRTGPRQRRRQSRARAGRAERRRQQTRRRWQHERRWRRGGGRRDGRGRGGCGGGVGGGGE